MQTRFGFMLIGIEGGAFISPATLDCREDALTYGDAAAEAFGIHPVDVVTVQDRSEETRQFLRSHGESADWLGKESI